MLCKMAPRPFSSEGLAEPRFPRHFVFDILVGWRARHGYFIRHLFLIMSKWKCDQTTRFLIQLYPIFSSFLFNSFVSRLQGVKLLIATVTLFLFFFSLTHPSSSCLRMLATFSSTERSIGDPPWAWKKKTKFVGCIPPYYTHHIWFLTIQTSLPPASQILLLTHHPVGLRAWLWVDETRVHCNLWIDCLHAGWLHARLTPWFCSFSSLYLRSIRPSPCTGDKTTTRSPFVNAFAERH